MTRIGSVSVGTTGVREPEHQHVVGVYDRDDELIPAILAFLADGLAPGGAGAAIVVATPEHRAALDAALIEHGFDVDGLRESGRYRSLDAREVLARFMVDGRPDPERFASSIGTLVGEAASGGEPLRLFGEMVALLWDDGDVAGAIELESLWNDLASRHSFALLCAYAISSLETVGDLAAAKRMCERHSSVVALAASSEELGARAIDASDAYARLFVAAPSELKSVREFVRNVLWSWGDATIGSAAEVIASELATNAVRHAQSPFRVSITRGVSTLRVAVRDASFDPPRHVSGNRAAGGGRGIRLVAALCASWGTDVETDGKTVWAEVVRHPVE